nr:MAG: hypothetical protein [Caudoviricetes sp.]
MKRTFVAISLIVASMTASAEPYGQYNQQYTMNQNYGVSNWMTAFGPGINTAAVTLVGGIVNAIARPEPQVVYQNQNNQPQVVQGQVYPQQAQYQQYQGGGYPYGYQPAPPNPYGQQPYYNR